MVIIIDPFHVCGNAAKLEDKTKEIFASVKQSYCSVLQFGCIPIDVKGVYTFSSCVQSFVVVHEKDNLVETGLVM